MTGALCCQGAWSNAVAALIAAGAGALLMSGCAAGPQVPPQRMRPATLAPAPAVPAPASSLVRVPRSDNAHPASVAAAFFTAWASADAVHDAPEADLARCAPLVTPGLRRQLAANQPGHAESQLMRRARLVSLVHVQAITHPAGAPAPSRARVFLRIYAERVTTTPAGRTVISDGVTVQLDYARGRWLVARLLFW